MSEIKLNEVMYKMEFFPFIGRNYFSNHFKPLILGESHHCGKGLKCCFKNNSTTKCNSLTNDVVGYYLNYKKTGKNFDRWMNTLTKFSNIYVGKKLSNSKTIALWESFIFYNYVQFPMSGPRKSPNFQNFHYSENALNDLLKESNPDLIFFWGYRLWSNFPKSNIVEIKINNTKISCYQIKDKVYPILVLPHPSSSKLDKGFTVAIKKLIDLIKYLKK